MSIGNLACFGEGGAQGGRVASPAPPLHEPCHMMAISWIGATDTGACLLEPAYENDEESTGHRRRADRACPAARPPSGPCDRVPWRNVASAPATATLKTDGP
jgi:hypothetical protein